MTVSTNAGAVAANLNAMGQQAQQRAVALTRHYGRLLQTQVKANASGRPGPRAQTGDYRRSIELQVVTTPQGITVDVGTNKPQGPRLEYGFHGADSLGRHYNQPPLPHFAPAFRNISPQFTAALSRVVP